MGARAGRRRALVLCMTLPAFLYLLHLPLLLLTDPGPVRAELDEISHSVLKPSEAVREYRPVRQIPTHNANITEILIAKKMGGILREMGHYRRLMREALQKGEDFKKAEKDKKLKAQRGLDSESLKAIKEQNNTKVTHFFHSLTMDVVNPFSYKYIINNETLCNNAGRPLSYLIYVHTAPGNQLRRNNLRQTWARPNLFPLFPSRIVFFVGQVGRGDGKKQAQLEEESRKFGDIVQLDFLDTYHNLTYKAMGAMRWIDEYCPNAQYVFKSDDDVFVNMPLLMQRLTQEFSNKTKFIMGLIWRYPSLHVQRPGKLCQKWCIPFNVLPGLDHYPTYTSGSFYIFNQHLAAHIYDMATRTPFFWVDDAYVTGIVAARIPELEHIDISKAYRFNLAIYKKSLDEPKPLMVTLTKDQPGLWKYLLPRIKGPHLKLLGTERHQQLMNEALLL